MAVTFRGKTIPGVETGEDTYAEEALEIADIIVSEHGHEVYAAEVDRTGGLIIYWMSELDFELDSSATRGQHFVTPICGYDGTGPMTTALILEKFGFGAAEDLIFQLNHGGNGAHFTFQRNRAAQ